MNVPDDDLYPLATQCSNVLTFMQKHRLTRIAIETNGIGNALPEIIRNIASQKHIPIHITQISNHIRKETRILNAIEPMLSTGRLFMHEKIKQTMLLSEMLAWTPIGSAEHDDGLDAVAGALTINSMPIRPANYVHKLIHANTEFKI